MKLVKLPKGVTHPLLRRVKPTGHQFKDRTGEKFGIMTVVGFVGFIEASSAWLVRCDECGYCRVVRALALHSNYNPTVCRHTGTTNHPSYPIWAHLKYWDRLCPRWRDSAATFYKEVGDRPSDNHQLVAPNRSKKLSPTNFEWARKKDLHRLRSKTFRAKVDGVWIEDSIKGWAERLGVSRQAIHQRLKNGRKKNLTLTQILSRPAHPGKEIN